MVMGDEKTMDSEAERKTRVFLSYSRRDMAMAERLYHALMGAGYDALLDKADIAAGEDWKTRLADLCRSADTVVFCVSAASSASSVCGWEVEEAERLGKRILPVVIDGSDLEQVHPLLARLNFIFFAGRDFDLSFDELHSALDTDLGWLREHTRLGELALDWKNAKRRTTGVLRGTALVDAEHWIASQPKNAAMATEVHRSFIAVSRRAQTTRQRGWIAGSLAVVVLSLGLAAWSEFNRREAVEQTRIATEQRVRAERLVATATQTANDLVYDLAVEFRTLEGVPVGVIRNILDKAQGLVVALGENGEKSDATQRAEAETLKYLTDTLLAQGDSQGAAATAQRAVEATREMASRDPGNTQFQRDHSISLDKLGTVQQSLGYHGAALENYSASLAIVEKLAAQLPDNAQTQRDLTVSYLNVADIKRLQTDFTGAFDYYKRGLLIVEQLAVAEPENVELKRDLSVFHDKLGLVQVGLTKFDGAIQNHLAAMAIARELVKQHPTNTVFQQDLSTSHEYVANAMEAKGNLAGAIANMQSALGILKKLAATDPGKLSWQSDLAMEHRRLGLMFEAQGGFELALGHFLQSLAIRRTLAASDPANQKWLEQLSIEYDKVGDVQVLLKKMGDALATYRLSLQVAQSLAALEPDNGSLQRDLAVSYLKLANNGENAGRYYKNALEIFRALQQKNAITEDDGTMIADLEELVRQNP